MAPTLQPGRIDLFRRFAPLPTQRAFLASRSKYRLLSSGFGAGKTKLGCRESIRHAVQYAGSRHLVSRYHYPDLRDTTLETFFRELREIGFSDGSGPGPRHYTWQKSDMDLIWWNGSKTLFRNLDVGEKFGSLELSTAFIDEGSEVPDGVYQVLFPSRLRWHIPGCQWADRENLDPDELAELKCTCPRRGWVCTNPGASGYLRMAVAGKLPDWEWFPVKPGENPYNGPTYNEELTRLGTAYGPVWLARYRDGSWDAFEGQRFTMFERERHLLGADFAPDPELHDVYEGWDFGFRNPTAVVWAAISKDGEYPPVVFHEYELAETEIDQHARNIKEIRAAYRLDPRKILSFGDPAGAQRRGSGMSDIMLYATHGIDIAPCTIGKMPQERANLLALLFSQKFVTRDGEQAGLMFAPKCIRLAQAILDYKFRTKANTAGEEQDPREEFTKVNDHLVDALGYMMMGIPREGPPASIVSAAGRSPRPNLPHRAPKQQSDDELLEQYGMLV